MKKILLLVLILVSLQAISQRPPLTQLPQKMEYKLYEVTNFFMVDSGLIVPRLDTNFIARWAGMLVRRPADGLLYMSNGNYTGKKWEAVTATGAGTGDITGGSNLGAGGVNVFNAENAGVLEFNTLSSNDFILSSNVITISTEGLQDDLFPAIVDAGSIDFTYNDVANTVSAQLLGDNASPGNSQYYGTNGSGVKGFYALPTSSTPILQQVFDVETGEALLNKSDTINNGDFNLYIRSTTVGSTGGFRVLQRSTVGQAKADFAASGAGGITFEASNTAFDEVTYFSMISGDNAGTWLYALDNDGRTKTLNVKLYPDSLYIHPNPTDLFNFIVAGLPNKASLAGTDSVLIQDASDKIWKVPSSAIGGGTVTSVAAGFGTNFTTITTTGSVIVDTTSGGVASWVRTKKIIDSLNAAGWGNGNIIEDLDATLNAGGTLTTNRTITVGTNTLDVTGSGSTAHFQSTHSSGAGMAFLGVNNGTGAGVEGRSISSYGVVSRVNSSATNSLVALTEHQLFTSATPVAGIGAYESYMLPISANNSQVFVRTAAKVTDLTTSSEDGDYEIWLRKAGTLTRSVAFISDGGIYLDAMTQDDAETRVVVWDATDKIFKWRASSTLGGGGGTVTDFIFTDGNGFDGTVTLSTSTPTLSLNTTVGNGQVFYSTSGAPTGSANLTYNAALLTSLSAGLGVTQDDTKGIVLINTTAAAVGAQQISPSLRMSGQGWKTNAIAASQEVEFRQYVLPIEGTANPSASWVLQSSINGGGYVDNLRVTSGSNILLNTGVVNSGSTGSLAMAGSEVRAGALNAIVFSTNAIDSSNNTFMGAGQNTVLQDGAGGAATFMTDGIVYSGAIYSFSANDANQVRAESGSVFGFGSRTSISYSIAAGLNVYLGNTSSTIGALNNYSQGFGFGGNLAATGNQTGNLGFNLLNTGNQAMVYGRGGGMTGNNSMAAVLAFFNNSDSATMYIKPAAGTTGTYGETELRGAFRLTNNAYNSGVSMVALAIDTLTGLVYRKTVTGGSGSPAGSDNQIQINDAGAFGVDSWSIDAGILRNATASGTAKLQVNGNAHITGTTSDGTTKTFELFALNGASRNAFWSDGHLTFNNGTATGAAPIEIVDENLGLIVRHSTSSSYTRYSARNDQNSSIRAFDFGLTGSTYTTYWTGGYSGEQGFIGTTGNVPVSIATNNTQRALITGGGEFQFAQQIRLPELTTPTTPASGFGLIYFKADGHAYALNDAGTETDLQAGGGSGHTIQEEGTPLTARANLNFIGSGFTAADDAGNNATTITLDADLNTWAGITPGTNVGTFLATPTSANLRAALTDENGTGAALFSGNTSAVFNTPQIDGTPTGTGVATGATASTLALRDANANITANNWLGGYTTTATAAGTTTLTVGSTYLQYFTGTTTQTVTLPVVSTLTLGHQFYITNNSTGAVTINSSGGNTVAILAPSTTIIVTCILTSGTSAASWNGEYNPVNSVAGKKVTFNNTLQFSGTDGTTMTFPGTSANVVGETQTQTLTNKRITARSNTTASTASLTVDSDVNDVYTVTALAAAMTINNPSGTPTEGQKLIIRIKDNGTARGLTWSGTQFRAGDIAFPTTTVVNKTMYIGLIWNSTDSKWDLIAYVDNL